MSVCRVHPAAPPLDAQILERARALASSTLSDCMERGGAAVGLRVVGPSPWRRTMVGAALTVRTRPGDNLVLQKAMDLCGPGQILVVDAGGEVANAVFGEIMQVYALHRGIAGVVVDGAVRDSAALRAGDLPVFARGVSPQGPHKSGPGELHGPVQVGGTVAHDGDLVLGDEDGVVIVPRARVAEVLAAAERTRAGELERIAAIPVGGYDRTWLDTALTLVPVEPEGGE